MGQSAPTSSLWRCKQDTRPEPRSLMQISRLCTFPGYHPCRGVLADGPSRGDFPRWPPLHPSSGLFPARPECQPLRLWRQSLRNAVEIGEAARSTGSSRGIEIPRSAITSLRDGGWVDGRMADGRSQGDFPVPPRCQPPRSAEQYLARYTHRVAFSRRGRSANPFGPGASHFGMPSRSARLRDRPAAREGLKSLAQR